ncbi:MAG TPA: hypothetical protein DCY88_08055 [Cyanobacteria bacterium UBA11372]|nr:hypothetical protein [Cyanobacteria bacterium UBA11372]HBE33926.1 hypothetical protein [Cyanobacteria bacterium UBA11368]
MSNCSAFGGKGDRLFGFTGIVAIAVLGKRERAQGRLGCSPSSLKIKTIISCPVASVVYRGGVKNTVRSQPRCLDSIRYQIIWLLAKGKFSAELANSFTY